jgi:hypothetical protein
MTQIVMTNDEAVTGSKKNFFVLLLRGIQQTTEVVENVKKSQKSTHPSEQRLSLLHITSKWISFVT